MIYIPASMARPEVIEAAKKLAPGHDVEIFGPGVKPDDVVIGLLGSLLLDGEIFVVKDYGDEQTTPA